ncbi:protein phosphatase [Actinorhabdospora filicis]|uniref:Protein phosphatase n=1 Tax=Actinorhabdospora filicis TaxID=1785913 RepID=A0A9W6SSQ9_9ACTN|nr:PP2C family serine/threonine-protein phosphatase [Actinorhabdospora filicis]GLZ81270.1 protein phosphatase [Actinorhabdospora filicis]
MTLTLRYAAKSDRGLIRDGNQDSVYAGPRLLAVADGMGGMAAGDVASNIAIATLSTLDEDVPRGNLADALSDAALEANDRIRATVDENPHMEGMGTTLVAFLFGGSTIGMINIGDSRAYRYRGGILTQITRDDTYVQMLVDEGRITPEEASVHPQRSLIMRALGTGELDPVAETFDPHPGDRYLLCSDGLSGVVSDETIAQTLREFADPGEATERLVQLALRGGGPDNITVIVADVTDADIVEGRPIVGGAAARDRGSVTSADPSSPAARAAAARAATGGPRDEAAVEDDDNEPPRRSKRRTLLWTLVVVLALGVLATGGYLYVQSQYYVGAAPSGHVAIFRGVPGTIAGLSFSKLEMESATRVADLNEVARANVEKGISADSLTKAREILAELTSTDPSNTNLLPLCPTSSPSSGTSSPSPDPSASAPPPTQENCRHGD